jgi:DNA-binding CsgD family transcriptional regulator
MQTDRVHHHCSPNIADHAGRRLRVLLCACTSQEASEVFCSFDGAETMHVPSADLLELATEMREFHPDLVLCGADFLRGLMPPNEAGHRTVPSATNTKLRSGATTLVLKSPDVSPRDLEVLQLLARGARNADIGRALNLAKSSVKRILQRLFEQFEAANRAELLGRAIELELFSGSRSGSTSESPFVRAS